MNPLTGDVAAGKRCIWILTRFGNVPDADVAAPDGGGRQYILPAFSAHV